MSSVYHVFHYSAFFNGNVERGCNERIIESNWRVNRATRKFEKN